MRTATFVIPGVPVGKGRARSTRSGHHYTPHRTQVAEAMVASCYLAKHDIDPHAGPVRMTVRAVFPIQRSWPKWMREKASRGELPCTNRIDIDNIVKAVADGLNGIAYTDDRQIIELRATKECGSIPRTEVTLTFEEEVGR